MLNFLKKYFNLSLTFFFITGLVFGSISGYFWANTRTRSLALSKLQLKSPNLKYTNPLLAFELGGKDQFDEFRQIDKAVDKIIAEAKNQGATNIGVYFRDLTTGHWTGINETSQFTPGSLQKVPLMIAYLKIAESNNGILSQQISDTYPTDANAMEIIKPKEFIEKNKKYSVEDMIRHMIIYSDNNATAALT
ncbi:MAG: serine hydrolase, partial [Candidatus Doudnabacteria bacterium]|nr:serine hydrolase [Candidatus Doudnabacteria bacterium]